MGNKEVGSLLNFDLSCNKNGQYDIYDGRLYREFRSQKDLDKYALTLQLYTDGVPLFKSSTTSIWPIYYVINELPSNVRKNYPILGGLWYGKKKPEVNSFFRRTVTELKNLSSKGFVWYLNGEKICSKVFLLTACADSVARCMLQNFTQFNGAFGCSWCHISGKRIPSGIMCLITYLNKTVI